MERKSYQGVCLHNQRATSIYQRRDGALPHAILISLLRWRFDQSLMPLFRTRPPPSSILISEREENAVHMIILFAPTIMFAFGVAKARPGSNIAAEARVSRMTPPRDRKH